MLSRQASSFARFHSSIMISFAPERGHILICDFDMANVPPEMRKKRRVVVVSPRSHNRARRCVVVPFSGTEPNDMTAAYVAFPVGLYRSLSVPTWAICSAVAHVSFDRLDRVRVGREFVTEFVDAADLERIARGLRHALGMD
jgi:uncharacterized protein YifN (PemK superfamily)